MEISLNLIDTQMLNRTIYEIFISLANFEIYTCIFIISRISHMRI